MKSRQIADPENYFKGINVSARVFCQNVLVFERRSKQALQSQDIVDQKYRVDRMHHRYILIRVIKTSGIVSIDGKGLTLKPGDLLFVAPYQLHHYSNLDAEDMHWLFVTFELLHGAEQMEALNHKVIQADERANAICDELIDLWLSKDVFRRLEVLPVLDRLVMHLIHQVHTTAQEARIVVKARENDWIVRVEGLLLRSIREGWSLEEVAQKANLSGRQLRSRFEKTMGMSLRDYRANYQLHIALSLMQYSDLNLLNVAELSGFNSQPSFTRFIKRMTGLSPRELRQSF